MKLKEIENEWSKDCKIDKRDLTGESLNISVIHNKYLKILVAENLLLKKLNLHHQKLELDKFEYYAGKMDQKYQDSLGWAQWNKTVLRPDIPRYIAGDEHIIVALLKIAEQNEKVECLREIFRSINTRSFNITNAIKWQQFTGGDQVD